MSSTPPRITIVAPTGAECAELSSQIAGLPGAEIHTRPGDLCRMNGTAISLMREPGIVLTRITDPNEADLEAIEGIAGSAERAARMIVLSDADMPLSVARRLLRAGADAHGFEVQQDMLDAAVASGVPAQRLKLGDGSALPWPDASFDLVLFVFSFHHVPLDSQPRMLAEVARLLRSAGQVIAIDPRPYGAMSETIKPLEDETHVRTASQGIALCILIAALEAERDARLNS